MTRNATETVPNRRDTLVTISVTVRASMRDKLDRLCKDRDSTRRRLGGRLLGEAVRNQAVSNTALHS